MPNDGATQTGATAAEQQAQLDAQAKADAAAKEKEEQQHAEEMRQRAAEPRMTEIERIAEARRKDMEGRGELQRAGQEELTDEERDDKAAEVERARLEEEAKKAKETEEQLRRQAAGGADAPTVLKPEDLGKFKVVQTIDGETREVSLDQVVREHQKGGAADYRLAKATEALDRADKIEREAAERAKTDRKPPADEDLDKPDPKVAQAIELMLDGKTDEAAKILSEAMAAAKGRSATPDPEAIVSAATHRIKMETQLNTFNTDYKDVVSDKYLAPMVDREFAELVPKDAKGDPKPLPPEEFGRTLREAGDKVRAWKETMSGGKKPPADEDPSKKLEAERLERERRKEALDQTTGAAARSSTAITTAEPTQQARSSAIAEIAKARGQQL